ncbi:hypothetical protein JTE90_011959 [Oedothorax gibbosus]|uniref:Uncharacterized protein n=1 Tax=Oedothorax gibbosus TaxID=931172 RepID=A0AAV6V2B2_9ARAC|nr:hypothetical protein JTE90_011959 [Oedothorax gibbosus]
MPPFTNIGITRFPRFRLFAYGKKDVSIMTRAITAISSCSLTCVCIRTCLATRLGHGGFDQRCRLSPVERLLEDSGIRALALQ